MMMFFFNNTTDLIMTFHTMFTEQFYSLDAVYVCYTTVTLLVIAHLNVSIDQLLILIEEHFQTTTEQQIHLQKQWDTEYQLGQQQMEQIRIYRNDCSLSIFKLFQIDWILIVEYTVFIAGYILLILRTV